jgi:hypothetical protein
MQDARRAFGTGISPLCTFGGREDHSQLAELYFVRLFGLIQRILSALNGSAMWLASGCKNGREIT